MASLKDLRDRIGSVKSTRKITSAMKTVAASKLRRAQEQAEAGRPYADRMARMMASLSARVDPNAAAGMPPLLAGTGRSETHLLVVVTADRGLCGGFNANLLRRVTRHIAELRQAGKTVRLLPVGSKGRDFLRRGHEELIVDSFAELDKPRLDFVKAAQIRDRLVELFEDGAFDVCELFSNHFKNTMSQVPTRRQLIPFAPPEMRDEQGAGEDEAGIKENGGTGPQALYEFEPSEAAILADLLPRNLAVQLFAALLDSAAGEQAARMTAMDNATRNAEDMIDDLTLVYNRTRQAVITTELTEIISGAEAL